MGRLTAVDIKSRLVTRLGWVKGDQRLQFAESRTNRIFVGNRGTLRGLGLDALVWLSQDVEAGAPSVGGEAYWVIGARDHSVIFASPSYLRLTGRSPDHLYRVPTGWLASVHPEDRARVMMSLNAAQTDGLYEVSYRRLMVDGEVHWFEDKGFLVHDGDEGSFIAGTTRRR